MFQNWQFLISEMILLLLLAALLGLIVGWIIWGRRNTAEGVTSAASNTDELHSPIAQQDAQIAQLQDQLSEQTSPAIEQPEPHPPEEAAPMADTIEPPAPPSQPDPVLTQDGDNQKPQGLSAPQEGGADDLKKIKGIGPKLEELCNDLGIYHFEQIANWQSTEVAWMDNNLKGFKGRVTRDDWVSQAQALAAGQDTEFSARVDKGQVY